VVLSPGHERDRASPKPTVSSALPMMGMVVLAFCPARIASSPAQKMGLGGL
jgi:hypothetical protein